MSDLLGSFGRHVNPGKLRILRSAGLGITEAKRSGARIWDETGRSYIDCVSGAGSFNAGRGNPALVEALCQAAQSVDLGNFLLASPWKGALAERLAQISPGDLQWAMFGASGGEVVDFAIKLARAWTGRPGIISAERSYHGHTGFALSAIGRATYQEPFGPLMPGFTKVPFGEIEPLTSLIDESVAAVILEPIQGEGGIRVPPAGYLRAVRALCDQTGALLILDEIQTGFGRTGSLFAAEYEGVVPDVMTLGKSLGGGLYPITAALFRAGMGDWLVANPFLHLSTFGGSDLGCQVALATIDWILAQDLPGHARQMGERFALGFAALQERHPECLTEVRGRGLMMGLQFTDGSIGPRLSPLLAERGVVAIYSGNDPSVMRLQPPLVITADEVDLVLAALDGALAELGRQGKAFGAEAGSGGPREATMALGAETRVGRPRRRPGREGGRPDGDA
ncbi:MAG TPA: aspartate aminotransferase family protein [Symbiobacteriaceae bacterium]|nr:aspartate aminotransferase family protein [Symbiobacteriaceae bacterium]